MLLLLLLLFLHVSVSSPALYVFLGPVMVGSSNVGGGWIVHHLVMLLLLKAIRLLLARRGVAPDDDASTLLIMAVVVAVLLVGDLLVMIVLVDHHQAPGTAVAQQMGSLQLAHGVSLGQRVFLSRCSRGLGLLLGHDGPGQVLGGLKVYPELWRQRRHRRRRRRRRHQCRRGDCRGRGPSWFLFHRRPRPQLLCQLLGLLPEEEGRRGEDADEEGAHAHHRPAVVYDVVAGGLLHGLDPAGHAEAVEALCTAVGVQLEGRAGLDVVIGEMTLKVQTHTEREMKAISFSPS